MSEGQQVGDAVDAAALGSVFVLERKIGEGSYGVVFQAHFADGAAPVAIKRLRVEGLQEGVPATAIREITLLQEMIHPNIVRLLKVSCAHRRIYLVFELLAQDLRSFIGRLYKSPQRPPAASVVPLPTIKSFTRQILDALWFCHQNRVVHRDIKPGNILVTHDGSCVKLADFGLARAFEVPLCTYTHEVVTLWYRAPEILLGEKRYTPAVDVWSVGCIVAEMTVGKPLFRGESEIDQLFKIFEVTGTPTEATWPGVTRMKEFSEKFPKWQPCDLKPAIPEDMCDVPTRQVIKWMLTADPKQRPTVSDLLNHPWFALS